MPQLKNYTGSVYGGLGHLLKAYCEANELVIPEQFKFKIWNATMWFGVIY